MSLINYIEQMPYTQDVFRFHMLFHTNEKSTESHKKDMENLILNLLSKRSQSEKITYYMIPTI